MSKNDKPLDKCKTWKELESYADHHGLPYDRSCGGHNIHKNERGSMPFSGHEKEPSKGLLHSVKKQIIKLTEGLAVICVLGLIIYLIAIQV